MDGEPGGEVGGCVQGCVRDRWRGEAAGPGAKPGQPVPGQGGGGDRGQDWAGGALRVAVRAGPGGVQRQGAEGRQHMPEAEQD